MTKRFGRNQKRRMREALAAAEAEIARARADADAAGRRARLAEAGKAKAYSDAFAEFTRMHGLLDHMVGRLGESMGVVLGDKLRPHAEKLLEAYWKTDLPRLRIIKEVDYRDHPVLTLRGHIEEIRYNIAFAPPFGAVTPSAYR